MYAFLSYQTDEKLVAGEVRGVLDSIGIKSFLAHEDIQVSEEWRHKILEEIGKADLFIPLLSKAYYASPWCMQESGIAAFRDGLTIIPLSLDGSIPPGFIGHIQSTKVEPGNIMLGNLLPGLAKKDPAFVIEIIIDKIKRSGSFRGAEANFAMILPFVGKASNEQMLMLLKVSLANGQVLHASQVAHEFMPPILESHGHLLDDDDRAELEKVVAQYA
jgi:hypothetical protein